MEQTLYNFIKDLFTLNDMPIHFVKLPCEDWDWMDLGLRSKILGIDFSSDYFNRWFRSLSPSVIYHHTDLFQCSYTIFLLSDTKEYVVIGPLLFEEIHDQQFETLFQKLSLPKETWEPLKNYYFNVKFIPYQSLYETFILSSTRFIQAKEPFQVLHQAAGAMEPWIKDQNFHFYIPKQPFSNIQHIEERYGIENIIFEAVTSGNEKKALEAFHKITEVMLPCRISDGLRDEKDLCISLDSILRKAAETAGVHPAYIDQYSNQNIQHIEQLPNSRQCKIFNRNMIIGYCKLVNRYQLKDFSLPIQKTITYINMEPVSDLTLKTLAAKLNMNANYLSTLFTKEVGIPLTEYVNRCRIEHAKHMLLSTELPIKRIAEQCGFTDIHYFTRMFKRITSLTPKVYREQGISEKIWAKPYFIKNRDVTT